MDRKTMLDEEVGKNRDKEKEGLSRKNENRVEKEERKGKEMS